MKIISRALIIIVVGLSVFSLFNCSKEQQAVKAEDVEVLKSEQLVSIDSSSLSEDTDVFFSDFVRDPDGSVYFLDGDSVKVYHFNRSRQLLRSFLKKGEGPGEFLGYPKLQLTGDRLWVLGRRKIGKFRKTGEFEEEYKQKSYFSAIHIVDEIHFLGTKERFPEDKNGKSMTVKMLGLFAFQDEVLKSTFLETKSNGRFFIPAGKRNISVIPDAGVVKDLKFGFNSLKNELAFADTNFYKIYIQNLTGGKRREFTLKTEKVPVSKEFKERIIKTFGKIPDNLKKRIFEGLPDYFCAMKKLRVLQNNMILVESLVSDGKSVFDLFDENGNFKKRFKIDPGFKFHTLKFFENRVGMIEDREDSSVYHEFKIITAHEPEPL